MVADSAEARHDVLMRLVSIDRARSGRARRGRMRSTTANRCRSQERWIFRAPFRISNFTRRPRCTPRTNRTKRSGTAINYTLRQPLGVVGCISPWNLPLYLFTWKVAPAIAAGCTVVAKPSEVTPMTAYLVVETLHRSRIAARRFEYRSRPRAKGRLGDRRA